MAHSDSDLLKLLRRFATTRSPNLDQPVSLPRPLMAQLLRMAFREDFDEEWYLERNPDVRDAMKSKSVKSALEHFSSSGIYEGRLPRRFPLDEDDYCDRHRDVAMSIKAGEIESATEHFFQVGFIEGRAFHLLP